LLASYTIGEDAETLGRLSPAERVGAVLPELARLHPELRRPGMVLGAAVPPGWAGTGGPAAAAPSTGDSRRWSRRRPRSRRCMETARSPRQREQRTGGRDHSGRRSCTCRDAAGPQLTV
jgi:hypothetical protein